MPDAARPPWWDGYFDRRFIRLYEPLLPRRRTRREVAGILRMLRLSPPERVLDLGCGWGRHSIRLARAGLKVTGLDWSAPLLHSAAQRAARAGAKVTWVRRDMRELHYERQFDAVLSLFSSLGYFGSDADDLRVLTGVRQALRPGGSLLLDTMHRDQVVRSFAERDWWQTKDGTTVWVERAFSALSGTVAEHWRWSTPTRSGHKAHQLRVRTATEWQTLLGEAGLHVEDAFGDWNGAPFSHTAEQLILVARRPA